MHLQTDRQSCNSHMVHDHDCYSCRQVDYGNTNMNDEQNLNNVENRFKSIINRQHREHISKLNKQYAEKKKEAFLKALPDNIEDVSDLSINNGYTDGNRSERNIQVSFDFNSDYKIFGDLNRTHSQEQAKVNEWQVNQLNRLSDWIADLEAKASIGNSEYTAFETETFE